MGNNEYKLKGHESFVLRDGWLTKGLRAVHENTKVFFENSGADALGVGTNMAKAIRYWLRAADLIEDSPRGASLTDFGELVFQNDLYIEDAFTLWVIHIHIVRNYALATSWNIFFNDISMNSFKRDELSSAMQSVYENRYGSSISERSVKDDCNAILQMYAEKEGTADPEDKKVCPFTSLGLISPVENGFYEKKRPAVNEIDPLIILYMIAETLNNEKVMQIDDIANLNDMPGNVLHLNRVLINDFLDALSNEGYLIINRTAGLDVVYPNANLSPLGILQKHYEGRQ